MRGRLGLRLHREVSMLRHLLAWLVIVVAMHVPTIGSGQTFRDDFDGTSINTERWVVDLVDGEIVVSNGHAIFTGGLNSFPVMSTRVDPFPPGNFRVVVGMQYLEQRFCGDGFGAMDNFWENYRFGIACRPFLLWQDTGGLYAYTGSAGGTSLVSPIDLNYHVFEWTYLDGQYSLSVDGQLMSSGSCAPRATQVFFGHPHPISCSPWTSFAVDFIQISPIGATPAHRTGWGQVKTTYR
jgi:hypothetical protein